MATNLSEARLIDLPFFPDSRGELSVVQFPEQLPFVPVRTFFVSRVPSESTRGEHAHRECHQAILCVNGAMTVTVEDRLGVRSFRLKSLSKMLYIPPGVWAAQDGYGKDTACAVFASHPYDPADYVRDFGNWRREYGLKEIENHS